jgi:hypothetical protein
LSVPQEAHQGLLGVRAIALTGNGAGVGHKAVTDPKTFDIDQNATGKLIKAS